MKLFQGVWSTLFVQMRKLSIEHRFGEFLGARLGEMLGELLIELSLEDFFGPAAVEIRRLANGRPHGLDHLPKKRFANKLREPLAKLIGVSSAICHFGRSNFPCRVPGRCHGVVFDSHMCFAQPRSD